MGEVSASYRREVKGQEGGSGKACPYAADRSMTPAIRRVLLMFPLRNVRKMCVVLQHNLGKGTCWPRPRCIPSGYWCSRGIEPLSHQQNVSPFYHSQEEPSRSSCTSIDQGDFAPPWTPRSKGRRWLPPLNSPSTRAWRFASPPGPNHAQTSGRLIASWGCVPAGDNTP